MLHAVEHIRPMRGGAQAHLIRADDGHCYVVKSLNNPQHSLILANEWLASGLARALGLSVPHFDVIDLTADFIAANPGLVIRASGRLMPVAQGFAFASQFPADDPKAPVYDYLPEQGLEMVENLREFAGILALDKWTCNCDGRQVIFCRPRPRGRMRAFFIDFGFCFNAGDWDFPDSPLRGVYSRTAVYHAVTGWESFEPWLSSIERFSENALLGLITTMPPEWVPDRHALVALLDQLHERRGKVRGLVRSVRYSQRAPFAHWTTEQSVIPSQERLFPQPV